MKLLKLRGFVAEPEPSNPMKMRVYASEICARYTADMLARLLQKNRA